MDRLDRETQLSSRVAMRTNCCRLLCRSLVRWASNTIVAATTSQASEEQHTILQGEYEKRRAAEGSLESEREQWETELEELDSDNSRLKQELRAKDELMEQLQEAQAIQEEDLDVMRVHVKQVEAELEQAHIDREHAEEQVAEKAQFLSESSQNEETHSTEIQQLVLQLEEMKAARHQVEQMSSDQASELESLQARVEEQSDQMSEWESEKAQLEQDVHDKEEMLEELLLEQQSDKDLHAQLLAVREELRELTDSSEQEQMQMAVELEELDMDKDKIDKQLQLKEETVHDLQEQNESQQQEIEEIRAELEEHLSGKKQLQGEYAKQRAAEGSLESERAQWETELEELDSDNSRLKQELQAKDELLEQLQETQEEDLEKARIDSMDAESRNAEQFTRLQESSESEREQLAEELEECMNEGDQLKEELQTKDQMLIAQLAIHEELQAALEKAESNQWSADSEREQWAAEVEEFVVERDRLQQQLKTRDESTKELHQVHEEELKRINLELNQARADKGKAEGMVAEKFKHFQESTTSERGEWQVQVEQLQAQQQKLAKELQSKDDHVAELRRLQVLQKDEDKLLQSQLEQANVGREKAERMVAEKFQQFQQTTQEEREQWTVELEDLEVENEKLKCELQSALTSKKSFIEELHHSKTAHDMLQLEMMSDKAALQQEVTNKSRSANLQVLVSLVCAH